MISLQCVVVASKQQVSTELSGEVVILGFSSGTYYGLDLVGARVWQLVQQPRTVQSVVEAILAEYNVDPRRCEDDVLSLLRKLADCSLVEVPGERPS